MIAQACIRFHLRAIRRLATFAQARRDALGPGSIAQRTCRIDDFGLLGGVQPDQ